MDTFSRRTFLTTLGGGVALAGCGNGLNSNGAATIDARVQATLAQMYREVPESGTLVDKAVGMLVMPSHERAVPSWPIVTNASSQAFGLAPS